MLKTHEILAEMFAEDVRHYAMKDYDCEYCRSMTDEDIASLAYERTIGIVRQIQILQALNID